MKASDPKYTCSRQTKPVATCKEPPKVFLPGWGFDGRILSLLPVPAPWFAPQKHLDPAVFEEELLAWLDTFALQTVELIGWSMGAHLALDFAGRHPERVAGLTLVSLRRSWPTGEIMAIKKAFRAAPAEFLADFYRKCFLGNRQEYSRFRNELEPHYLRDIPEEELDRGLDFLATAGSDSVPGIATRQIHGRRDIVAPLSEMAGVADAKTEILDQAGHLPFLEPKCSLVRDLFKDTIRHKFSRAASTYDRHARIQKQLADILARELADHALTEEAETILEIGCGPGNFTRQLASLYPHSRITALDFSPAMLDEARNKLGPGQRISLICEDGERFLAVSEPALFDLIVSNGTLQWFGNPAAAAADIHRLLRPGGYFLAGIFGPASLRELARGLTELFPEKTELSAAGFPGRRELDRIFAESFPGTEIREITLTTRYDSVVELFRHLKKTGTTGAASPSGRLLTGSRLAGLDRWFVEEYGECRVTYQAFIVKGRRGSGP